MFVAGMIVGVVSTSFFVGLRSDDPESIGRGIQHMISASKNRSEAIVETPAPEKPAASPSFDFYQVLPEIEQIIPDNAEPESVPVPEAVVQTTEDTPTATEPGAKKSYYMLQAGSFARLGDADRLKAQLALEGLVSSIQKVSIQGRGDFYRVRLGPFEDAGSLKSANQRLAAIGIKALRLRISAG